MSLDVIIHVDFNIGFYHGSVIESKTLQVYTYAHAQTAFTLSNVKNRVEHVIAAQIIKHKYMLLCLRGSYA